MPTAHGAFAKAAMTYRNARVPVIPCGGDDGKTPLITNWSRWKRIPARAAISKWAEQFPQAGIGIVTGALSRITVIDCDDPAVVAPMIRRFGDTPVKVRTPRGGVHLYYRFAGEGCATGLDGMKVDVRGQGGFVVAPPSTRPGNPAPYSFMEGTVADFVRLPMIKPGSLQQGCAGPHTGGSYDPLPEGQRNKGLFRIALREVRLTESEDHLFLTLNMFNDMLCAPPLLETEVRAIGRSAMKMEAEGRNWLGAPARAVLEGEEVDRLLPEDSNALILLAYLRRHHGWRCGDEFALANAAAKVLGLSLPAFRSARHRLEELGFIECLHAGGRGPSDPPIYRLCQGVRKRYQYNNTRPPGGHGSASAYKDRTAWAEWRLTPAPWAARPVKDIIGLS